MSQARKRRLCLLTVIYLLVLCIPVIGALSDISLRESLNASRLILLLSNSMMLALVSAVIASILGFFGALYIHNGFLSDKWYRYYFLLLLPVPFYIYALSWIYAIRMAAYLTPAVLKYSLKGFVACVFTESLEYYPVSLLFCLIGMESINNSQIEAASLIKGPGSVVKDIILREVFPYLLAGAGLIMILSMTDFSVPSMFQFNTYTLDLFSLFGRTGEAGTVYLRSLPMILIMLIPFTWLLGIMRRFDTVRSNLPYATIRLKGPVKAAAALAFIISILQVLIPLVTFVFTTGNMTVLSDAISISGDEIAVSLVTSVMAAFIGTLLAIAPAVYISEKKSAIMGMVLLLPVVVPGAITSVGLLRAVNITPFYILGKTVILCAFGCAIKLMPVLVIVICIFKRYIDRRSIEISRVLALKERDTIRLERRLMLPGISVAFLLAFFLTFAEEGIFLVLMAPGREAITVKIYNYLHYGASDYVSALCLIALGVILIIELIAVAIYRIAGGNRC